MGYKKVYRNLDLRRTDFASTNLVGVKFINCNIGFSDFSHSDLSYAVFEHCDLYNVNFSYSVMYSTQLTVCDCTKTSFNNAYLNGLKTSDIFIVHTEFGFSFNTGKERKPIELSKLNGNYYTAHIGKMPMTISDVENEFDGIYCLDTGIVIQFIDTSSNVNRVWIRRSEIAKNIKLILEQNGYADKAIEYYFYHRKFQRKSKPYIQRYSELLFSELFWGYGVKITNPITTFFVLVILFSLIYASLPYISIFGYESGMIMDNQLLSIYNEETGFSILSFCKILYGSFLISSISIFGSLDTIGIACIFAVIQILISILLLGLGVVALGKKMSNV